jgi:diguanylate cyclase (GGDEF)-like protein/PAS domain S-box-containing protein
VALGLYVAAALACTYWDIGPARPRAVIAALALFVTTLAAAVFAFRIALSAELPVPIRRTWTYFGLAALTHVFARLLWTWQAVILSRTHISPWFEAPFLARYPFVLAGILSLPPALRSGEDRRRFFLDAATVVGAGAMGIWYFILYPGLPARESAASAVALLYSVGDLVLLLGIATIWLRRRTLWEGDAIKLLGAAFTVNFVTDIAYAWQVGQGTFRSGGILHPFWVLASGLFAASAHMQYRERNEVGLVIPLPATAHSRPSLLPYTALAAGYGLLLSVAVRDGHQPLAGLVAGGMALTALVVARQVAAVQENLRLLAERSAQESEARFRALVQHSSDVISILDPDTTIRFASPAVAGVVGRVSEALVGTRLVDLIHPDDQDRAARLIRSTARTPAGSASSDWRLRHHDGEWVFTENIVTNLLSEPTIRGLVVNTRDVSEKRVLQEQLTWQAFHDPLTRRPNRSVFRDRVAHALVRSARSEEAIAVLFVDLDNFKLVNDTLGGHAEGDRVLIAAADRLTGCVRAADTVARLGGDEFAILLEDAKDVAGVAEVAERIVGALGEPFELKGRSTRVGASVGIARSHRGQTPEELLRDADLAMYFAKAKGKGRFEMFEPQMHVAVHGRLENEADLRRALDALEFRLFYQPILDLEHRAVVGFEALLRWVHPRRGVITPDAFIPLAEETGLIVPLDRWAIREVCRQWREWSDAHPGLELQVNINISASHFQDASLIVDVVAALSEFQLPAEALVLEITETLLMHRTETTRDRLRELKALGLSLAVDDFGTGYSSLGYLHSFPIDVLKIDRTFVRGMGGGSSQPPIAETIIGLAKTMRLSTVAEGIEQESEVEALRSLGCRFGQGFLFAEARPPEDLGRFLVPPERRLRELRSEAGPARTSPRT